MVPVFLHGKKIELRVKLRELSEGVGLADELYRGEAVSSMWAAPEKLCFSPGEAGGVRSMTTEGKIRTMLGRMYRDEK